MYKKHFNKEEGCKKPYEILRKEMIFIGKMSWVLHSAYATEDARNNVLQILKEL